MTIELRALGPKAHKADCMDMGKSVMKSILSSCLLRAYRKHGLNKTFEKPTEEARTTNEAAKEPEVDPDFLEKLARMQEAAKKDIGVWLSLLAALCDDDSMIGLPFAFQMHQLMQNATKLLTKVASYPEWVCYMEDAPGVMAYVRAYSGEGILTPTEMKEVVAVFLKYRPYVLEELKKDEKVGEHESYLDEYIETLQSIADNDCGSQTL